MTAIGTSRLKDFASACPQLAKAEAGESRYRYNVEAMRFQRKQQDSQSEGEA